MKKTLYLIALIVLICNAGCGKKPETNTNTLSEENAIGNHSSENYKQAGSIEFIDPALEQLIPRDAKIEILADGFEWTEGPVWVPELNALLFSDIPKNKVYRWSEADGLKDYLEPSGYSGDQDYSNEPGSNGLLLDKQGNLVLCQHGNRQLAQMESPIINPAPKFKTLARQYEGKRFNSPNDAVMKSNGDFYFTDPPYGLKGNADDPSRELDFMGVYRVDTKGKVTLLTKALTRPNGIGFSPDEKTLYVANSDPENPIWMAFDVKENGLIENERVFANAAEAAKTESGMPDGMAVDKKGNLFATGPGGVWILTPEGKHLGTIKTGEATANCTFNEDESVLYITADMYLMRVKL